MQVMEQLILNMRQRLKFAALEVVEWLEKAEDSAKSKRTTTMAMGLNSRRPPKCRNTATASM